MMTATLPMPDIPDLKSDNTIDLDELGDASLPTWINYDGIAEGDKFWPTWWGCTALGEAVDDFDELTEILPGELTPQGVRVLISNTKLKDLNQGWVFYSYRMYDSGEPDARGEESLRRFFYVGKRSSSTSLLPAPQFKESHGLALDPNSIGDGGTTIVMAPYQAMSAGDKVTLTVDRYIDEDFPWDPITLTKELINVDVGKPLQWPSISKNEFEIIVDGFAHMSYRIDYATPTVPTESARQTVHIVTPPDTWLSAPQVKGFNDEEELDPDLFPDGMTLTIEPYPGIQLNDDVMVYASGETSVIKTLRVDASTMDSAILEVNLERAWLLANVSKEVNFMYQYARVGSAGTSKPLALTLTKPLKLPLPIVENATPDAEGGFLLPARITGGVYIKLPDDAEIGGNKVQMHWEGHGSTGSHIADPMLGYPKRFFIPPEAVPANMGKRLKVFYKVTPPGKNSQVFDLEIRDMTTGWPALQISSPTSPNNKVSLGAVTGFVVFKLRSWPYMSAGQRVKIKVEGLLSAGGKDVFDMRTGAKEVVTEDEYYAGELEAKLPKDFLMKLAIDQQFDVFVSTSFDDGFTYKTFPQISPQLIA